MKKRAAWNKGNFLQNKVKKKGKIAKIELYDKSKNLVDIALIDSEDWEKVKSFRWHRKVSRGKGKYVNSLTGGKYIGIHNIIMGGKRIDHINRNGLDNRKKNLRFADYTLQNINKGIQSNNKSGYKGVHFHPKTIAGKSYLYWEATISVKNKTIFLGCFTNKRKAIFARKKAEEIYFKNYGI